MRSALGGAVALYVAAALVAWALLWGLGDHHWIASPLLFGARWVLLLPLAVLVPLAARRRRRRRSSRGSRHDAPPGVRRPSRRRPRLLLPLAAAALVVLGPVMGGEIGWGRLRPAPAGMPFRVVTYNVGSAEDGAVDVAYRLHRMLLDWRADVVVFQECGYYLGQAIRRLEEWQGDVRGELCMVSRHPIAGAAELDRETLNRMWRRQLRQDGGGEAIRYTLTTERGPVSLTHVHLETPREGVWGDVGDVPRKVQRNIELRDLESMAARALADEGTRRIVVGDFNMPVESRIFRRHWGDLTDAFSAVGTGWGATRYAGAIRARIDHVLVDDRWRVREIRVENPMALDHGAVVADLVLPDA